MRHLFAYRFVYQFLMLVIFSSALALADANAESTCSNYEFYVEATPRASSKADMIAQNIYDVLNKDRNGLVSYSLNYIFNDEIANGHVAEARQLNLSSNSSICIQPSDIDISLLADNIRRIERKKGSCEGVYTYLELSRNLVRDASRNPNTTIYAYYTFICPFTDSATFNRELAMSESKFIKYGGEINKLSNLNIYKLKERSPGVSEQDIYVKVLPKTDTTLASKSSRHSSKPQKKMVAVKAKPPVEIEPALPEPKGIESKQEEQPPVAEIRIFENATTPVAVSSFQNSTFTVKNGLECGNFLELSNSTSNSTFQTCTVKARYLCESDEIEIGTQSNPKKDSSKIEITYAKETYRLELDKFHKFPFDNSIRSFHVEILYPESEDKNIKLGSRKRDIPIPSGDRT